MLMPSNRISSVFWSPVLFSFRRNLHAEINYDPITQLPLTFLLHETSTTSTPTSTKAAWTVSPHFPIHVMLQHLELHFKQPLDTSNLFTRISSPSQSNHLRWCRSVSLLDIVKYTLFHQAQLEWRCPQLSFEIMLPSFEERSKPIQQALLLLQKEFQELDQIKQKCDTHSEKSANRLVWGGLLGLCTQWGLMARLTWWEYSWDVMEPISYFITFGTAIVGYMFYIVTKREYTYETLTGLHMNRKQATLYKKANLDIHRYSTLKQQLTHHQELLNLIQNEYAPKATQIFQSTPNLSIQSNSDDSASLIGEVKSGL